MTIDLLIRSGGRLTKRANCQMEHMSKMNELGKCLHNFGTILLPISFAKNVQRFLYELNIYHIIRNRHTGWVRIEGETLSISQIFIFGFIVSLTWASLLFLSLDGSDYHEKLFLLDFLIAFQRGFSAEWGFLQKKIQQTTIRRSLTRSWGATKASELMLDWQKE